MDIDVSFLPVAQELIDNVFPTPIVYHEAGTPTYDPMTGTVTAGNTDHTINAGVLSRKRIEEGGSGATYEISVWVHHGAAGVPFLPKTKDTFTYDGTVWVVVSVDPTYSSKALIASKLTARAA